MRYQDVSEAVRQVLLSHQTVVRIVPVVLVLCFALLLFPGAGVHRYDYQVGDVVEKDIKSPEDFVIEDVAATNVKRRQAMEEVLAVYDVDPRLAGKISQNLQDAFADMRMQTNSEEGASDAPESAGTRPGNETNPNAHENTTQLKERLETKLGISLRADTFAVLKRNGFAEDIAKDISNLIASVLDVGVVTNRELLLKESPRGIVLRDIETRQETVVRTLNGFYGLDQPHGIIRHIGAPLLEQPDLRLRNVMVDLVQHLLQPNITFNRNETQARITAAGDQVKPVFYKVKAGEMLMREGDRVTSEQLLKLASLQLMHTDREIFTSRLGAALIMLGLLLMVWLLLGFVEPRLQEDRNRHILFFASLLLLFMLLAGVMAAVPHRLGTDLSAVVSLQKLFLMLPLASGAMIIAVFLGLKTALGFALVLSLAAGFFYEGSFEVWLYFLLNSALGAYWVRCCRERIMFMRAGFFMGWLNMGLATALILYSGDLTPARFLWGWGFAFFGGLLAGILTTGLAPAAESLFGYTSDIKLLELANLDRPILRRLMFEAPGTYHHSLLVSSLVEAAATEIGANSLLAKVGAYYHDIGKMKKPLYFIENQQHGKNVHDKLAPSMSRRILIMHVKDGVEMARENKLGSEITDIIQQHHGTSLISYFYGKALEKKGEQEVNIDDYRYPGPRPQTREAGLVMLADVVEAASRSLDNPTPSRIQGLVQQLINKIFSDGQLDNCELTLRDLHSIAKTFTRILNGIHHHRVEYPDKATASNGKSKNGRSDRQPPKSEKNSEKAPPATGTGGLKRLGLS